MLIGEMRDTETAQIAMRAAITGHMVLSTLHVREAASAPVRLLDMGVPRYMVATSLQAVIAQRLVRRICESCAEDLLAHAAGAAFRRGGVERHGKERLQEGQGLHALRRQRLPRPHRSHEMLEMTPRLVEATARRT